jgi:Ferroportin1 (FPN1)
MAEIVDDDAVPLRSFSMDTRFATDNSRSIVMREDGDSVSRDSESTSQSVHLGRESTGSVGSSMSDAAILRTLYTSHFLSAWSSRAFEFAATLFLAVIFPGTLWWASCYALVRMFYLISTTLFLANHGRFVPCLEC